MSLPRHVPSERLERLIGSGEPTSDEIHDMAVELIVRRRHELDTPSPPTKVIGEEVYGDPLHAVRDLESIKKAEAVLNKFRDTPPPVFGYSAVRYLLACAFRDDPELDATDGAHPAWWRGNDHGVAAATDIIKNALEGKAGEGTLGFEPLQRVREQIYHTLKGLRDMQTAAAIALEALPEEEGWVIRVFLEAIHRHAATHLAAAPDPKFDWPTDDAGAELRPNVHTLSAADANLGSIRMEDMKLGELPPLPALHPGATSGLFLIKYQCRQLSSLWQDVPDGVSSEALRKQGFEIRAIYSNVP